MQKDLTDTFPGLRIFGWGDVPGELHLLQTVPGDKSCEPFGDRCRLPADDAVPWYF